jgi:hypothetical protein
LAAERLSLLFAQFRLELAVLIDVIWPPEYLLIHHHHHHHHHTPTKVSFILIALSSPESHKHEVAQHSHYRWSGRFCRGFWCVSHTSEI